MSTGTAAFERTPPVQPVFQTLYMAKQWALFPFIAHATEGPDPLSLEVSSPDPSVLPNIKLNEVIAKLKKRLIFLPPE
jgi:hypothetical protein